MSYFYISAHSFYKVYTLHRVCIEHLVLCLIKMTLEKHFCNKNDDCRITTKVTVQTYSHKHLHSMRSTPKIEPDTEQLFFFLLQEGVTNTTVKLSKRSQRHIFPACYSVSFPQFKMNNSSWGEEEESEESGLFSRCSAWGPGVHRCSAGVWVDLPKPVWSCSTESLSKTWKNMTDHNQMELVLSIFPQACLLLLLEALRSQDCLVWEDAELLFIPMQVFFEVL